MRMTCAELASVFAGFGELLNEKCPDAAEQCLGLSTQFHIGAFQAPQKRPGSVYYSNHGRNHATVDEMQLFGPIFGTT
jgi:hypothetical protein